MVGESFPGNGFCSHSDIVMSIKMHFIPTDEVRRARHLVGSADFSHSSARQTKKNPKKTCIMYQYIKKIEGSRSLTILQSS